jgi:hypothetical protein
MAVKSNDYYRLNTQMEIARKAVGILKEKGADGSALDQTFFYQPEGKQWKAHHMDCPGNLGVLIRYHFPPLPVSEKGAGVRLRIYMVDKSQKEQAGLPEKTLTSFDAGNYHVYIAEGPQTDPG